jgi:hypothetical protein
MESAHMTRTFALRTALAALAFVAATAAARGETYKQVPNPKLPAGIQMKQYPPGWICTWSMDIKGKELKTIEVGGSGAMDATTCSPHDCASACDKTAGCIAFDVTKPGSNQCICTLFGSVTSATLFEEIRAPRGQTLSGFACLRAPKAPPPPMKEVPNFPGTDRPGFEQDRQRPGTTGTPGRSRP